MSEDSNKYQLFIKGLREETISIMVHKDALTSELFKKLEEKTGVPLQETRLIHAGKEIEKKDKRISDYPAIGHGSTMFMVMRLLGGNDTYVEDPPFVKELDELAELTDEPDMITWDDDPEGKRAKMPCGHAISPDSLTAYCRSLLSAGKFQFNCPFIDRTSGTCCNTEWPYIDVRRFGVLSKDEQKDFETKISENYLRKAMGIQECPGCHSLCERKSKKDKRLICPICTKKSDRRFDFCWNCLHEWKGSGTDKCGNDECSNEDPRMKILRDAPIKQVVGVKTPSRRACPTCGMLIEHMRACKHMVCPCGTQFCFICLKTRDPASGWTCGIYNAKCEPAAKQTSIPGQ